jgi:UDP-N-acetylmuramoyl-L-alanyl-D-glutamate--2,6-diaminopimelate ligase
MVAENIETNNGVSFQLQTTNYKLQIFGKFNIYNSLAAISVAKAYGIGLEICKKALEKVKGIPGRMEVVAEKPVKVIVDYAHTPEQLEAVYKSLSPKPYPLNPNLICVLGSCGGGRDKWKRPALGKLAAKYCKEIIITNEDPYDENPLSIMNEIENGFSQIRNPKSEIRKILDRKEAIKTAIKLAKPGDVVIITGKGSEPWMCVENGKKIPWDDRQIARDALKNIK